MTQLGRFVRLSVSGVEVSRLPCNRRVEIEADARFSGVCCGKPKLYRAGARLTLSNSAHRLASALVGHTMLLRFGEKEGACLPHSMHLRKHRARGRGGFISSHGTGCSKIAHRARSAPVAHLPDGGLSLAIEMSVCPELRSACAQLRVRWVTSRSIAGVMARSSTPIHLCRQ